MADSSPPVLVYKLPFDLLAEALAIFPKEHIEKIEHEGVGMKIYFKKYSIAREYILKRSIYIQGSHYIICPAVTNLTLHGIRKYASISTIKDMMTPYGHVVNLYPVEEITKEGIFEKKSLKDDYRVVLGVPEAQIDFLLPPLQLPDIKDHGFVISFFCRLCRQNGHMQIHCPENFHCSVTQKEGVFQNKPRTERQSPYTGKKCCENSKEEVHSSSNSQNGLQVSKEKISIQINKGEVRIQEGQVKCKVKSNDRFSCSQAEKISAHASARSGFESQNAKKYLQPEHATQENSLYTNVKGAAEPLQDATHTHLQGDLTSQTTFYTNQSNAANGNDRFSCSQPEKINVHTSARSGFESQNDKKYLQPEHATQKNSLYSNVKGATEPLQDATYIHLHGDLTSQTSFYTNQSNAANGNDRFSCSQPEKINVHTSARSGFESQNYKKYLQPEHATQKNSLYTNVKGAAEPLQDATHIHLHGDLTSQTSFYTNQSNARNGNDRFSCSQAEKINAHASARSGFESQNDKKYLQSEHATQKNSLYTNVKGAAEPLQDATQIHLHGDLTSQSSFYTNQSNAANEYGNHLQEENILCCKSKSSMPNNLPKSSDADMWNRITPPNAHPGKTKRLLKSILEKEKRLNLSPNVERKLQEILEWNHHGRKEYLEENERKFIKWLKLYLAEVSHNRTHSGHSEGEQVYQPQNATGDQISGVEAKKKRQGVLYLCPGIEEIVLKTNGVLEPEILRNFLNQVRGRKKQMEIAEICEKDFFALSNQLNEVIKSYYLYGKRGAREDGDIKFIERLKDKLMQESTAKEKQSYPREQPSFNKESVTKRIPSHNSKNQNNVNYYNRNKAQTSRVEMARETVESRKYSRKKYLPNRGQSYRIPKSPEFCPPKLSKETFQSKRQRSSINDGNCFKTSDTERKCRKNIQLINKNELPAEITSRQILNDRKSPSFRGNVRREFERNFSFDGSQCTSGLNYSFRNASLEVTAHDIVKDKRNSNKRSSFSPRFSTSGDSLTHHEQNGFIDDPSTESQNVKSQPSSAEEFPEISKSDLLEILSCTRQSDTAEDVSKITKGQLQQILSYAHQSTEHS